MQSLGFDNYAEPLKLYLARYRELTLKSEKSPLVVSKEESNHDMDVNPAIFQ